MLSLPPHGCARHSGARGFLAGARPAVARRGADGAFTEEARTTPKAATRFGGGGGLYSTAGDYLRFLQMLLNGGELGGRRVLTRESVALMGRNYIGAVGVRAVKSTQPAWSADFTFVGDGRDKWGLNFDGAMTPSSSPLKIRLSPN